MDDGQLMMDDGGQLMVCEPPRTLRFPSSIDNAEFGATMELTA